MEHKMIFLCIPGCYSGLPLVSEDKGRLDERRGCVSPSCRPFDLPQEVNGPIERHWGMPVILTSHTSKAASLPRERELTRRTQSGWPSNTEERFISCKSGIGIPRRKWEVALEWICVRADYKGWPDGTTAPRRTNLSHHPNTPPPFQHEAGGERQESLPVFFICGREGKRSPGRGHRAQGSFEIIDEKSGQGR